MEVECDYCNAINSVPRLYSTWAYFTCYNCGTDLPIKPHKTSRYKSAYSRRPFAAHDDTTDYSFLSRPLRARDLSRPPTHRMDTSMYVRPFEMTDTSYPIDSRFYTPRVSHRYEKPTYSYDRTPSFRREKTDMRFDSFGYRPKLTIDETSPVSTYSRVSKFPKPTLIRELTSSKPRFCSYQALCREYLWSLNWPREYFNTRFNRCYCSQCYPASYKDAYTTAGKTYVIPRGWVRFGLYVDEVKANRENLWNTWIVTYHGTKKSAAQSIIAHRQFLIPGDTCDDGTIIGIREGHIPGKKQVYTSPTIKYSSLPCYCDRDRYQASNGITYKAKIVLQCRQQPGTYETQHETVGSGTKRICNIIPNDQIEIFTTVRSAVVPYGLLIQLTPI